MGALMIAGVALSYYHINDRLFLSYFRPPVFIAGIFLGWVYWKTHSLWACIFIHAVNNGTAYFIQLLNPQLPAGCTYKDFLDMHMPGIYWIVFVIFAVSLAVILRCLHKNLN